MKTELSVEKSAERILLGLIGVYKKLHLYSESHAVYHNGLKQLKELFEEHSPRYGNLRIQIERKNILFQGELLYEGGAEPTDPAFLLHRDGILWLEFQNGIELWEIDTFLKILRDNCILDEDPEDDIVTALWAVNLPSILYDAADLELGLPDDVDFSQLACSGRQASDSAQNEEPVRCETIYSAMATNVLSREGQDELWKLTATERDQLRKTIAAEEQVDGSDYVIDALLYILENHCLPEDIAELLDTLLQELNGAFANARFAYLLEAVTRLKKIAAANPPASPWLKPHIEQFLANLAAEPFSNGLKQIDGKKQKFDAAQLKNLKRFLLLLDRSAIPALGAILMEMSSPELQRIILETIGTMAMTDFEPLEKFIQEADPPLAARLVFLLRFLKDPRSRQSLSNLIRHPSKIVRLAALKAVMSRDDRAIDEILSLIDDPDEKIRKLVLNRLGRDRSAHVEGRLLGYLDRYGQGLRNAEHFIAVCRTLGKCGSERSIPYLIKLLFKWPAIGVLRSRGSDLRRGAVVALQTLRTEKAARLIDRNHRGFLRNLFRSAVQSSD
mgnify:CR=1 FL=1